jgi:hypothetical protein
MVSTVSGASASGMVASVRLVLVGRDHPSRGPCNVVASAQLRFGGEAGQLLISVS